MLVCKGERVDFDLFGRKRVVAPVRAGLLHDPEGEKWPACSLLIVGFARGRRAATDEEYAGAPREYLGRNYEARVGSVELPPRALSEWKKLGEVKRIYYERGGTKYPGDFKHDFNRPRGIFRVVFLFKKKGEAILYRRGSALRLELPRNCIVDDRGLVFP